MNRCRDKGKLNWDVVKDIGNRQSGFRKISLCKKEANVETEQTKKKNKQEALPTFTFTFEFYQLHRDI